MLRDVLTCQEASLSSVLLRVLTLFFSEPRACSLNRMASFYSLNPCLHTNLSNLLQVLLHRGSAKSNQTLCRDIIRIMNHVCGEYKGPA